MLCSSDCITMMENLFRLNQKVTEGSLFTREHLYTIDPSLIRLWVHLQSNLTSLITVLTVQSKSIANIIQHALNVFRLAVKVRTLLVESGVKPRTSVPPNMIKMYRVILGSSVCTQGGAGPTYVSNSMSHEDHWR